MQKHWPAICGFFLLLVIGQRLPAQSVPPPNLDETNVPKYVLPDPLVFSDGSKVDTPKKWTQRRRAEVLALFEEHVYGKTPVGTEDR